MSLLWIGYYKIVKLWHCDIHYFVRQWLATTDEYVPEIKSFKSGIHGIFIIVCRFYESSTQTIFNKQCFICISVFFSSLLNRRFDDEGEWEIVSEFASSCNLRILSKTSWNRFFCWSKLITVFFLLILWWSRIERTRYIQVTGIIIFRNHMHCIAQIVQPFHQSGPVHVQLHLLATIALLVTFWIMFYTKHSSKINQKC